MADGDSARPGGRAKGGTAPQPGDPASPGQAADHAAKSDADMAAAGFGDHKGGRIRGPDEKGGEQR